MHPTQEILDWVARAYFSGDRWDQRIWRALAVLLELVAANPVMSHLRLVECYTAGPAAVRRAEEATHSFTIFLEEGYRQRPEAGELPRLFSEAIARAIFEIIPPHVARGGTPPLPPPLPQPPHPPPAPLPGPGAALPALP